MEWKNIKAPEWHDPIICYSDEGVIVQETKIRPIVESEGKIFDMEEIDLIVDFLMTELGGFEGAVTRSMIVNVIKMYRSQKAQSMMMGIEEL